MKSPAVIVMGVGNIGKRVVELLEKKQVGVLGLVGSSTYVGYSRPTTNASKLLQRFADVKKDEGKKMTFREIKSKMTEAIGNYEGNTIVVDCSASDDTAKFFSDVLSLDGGIVLANKKALASENSVYKKLMKHKNVRFEATVGAGLPVIVTAKRMLDSGDEITQITGQLSGTLGYLLSRLDDPSKGTFSDAVKEAEKLGYTEPDPRDDLGGVDVARKALILSRYAMEKTDMQMKDIDIEALFPTEFASLSVDEFRKRLPELDGEWSKRIESAKQNNCVWRYAAQISREGKTKVGLVQVPLGNPLASLKGTLNLVSFQSTFYPQGKETVVSKICFC